MSRRRYIAAAALCFGILQSASAQDGPVSNIRFEVDQETILVLYDLQGSAPSYLVVASVSLDGGRSFVPMRAVEGDVGKDILPGLARTIRWFVFTDFPDGLASEAIVFEVSADAVQPKKKRGLVYALVGAAVAGAGGTIALLLGGSSGGDDPGGGGGTTAAFPDPPGPPGG